MTIIARPVTRRTRGAYAVLYHQPRPIVVTLAEGDLLEFRETGRRTKWTLPIETAFRQAVRVHAIANAAQGRNRGRKG
jgi:hypothetical protein